MISGKGHWLRENGVGTALAVTIVVVYLVEAFCSEGFHHPDEHFQIVEFAQWKMGASTPASVAWELTAHIRPSLQPCLCMLLLAACRGLGIGSAFALALALRLVAAALSLTALTAFYRANSKAMPTASRHLFMALTFLLWFLPAINVRFSSESFSDACLLLCLANVCAQRPSSVWRLFVIGVWAGLGFAFRYQLAFALTGLAGWALFTRRYTLRQWACIMAGFMLVTLTCICLDAWFYGQWVLVPYRYFHVNIIEGVASTFGQQPWYAYMMMLALRSTLPIGVMVLGALVVAMAHHYRHPAVWCLVAFVAGHSLVAHKELRFLFPIANLLPLMLVWGYDWLRRLRWTHVMASVLFVLINSAGLAMMLTKPAAYGKTRMMRMATEAWRQGHDLYVSDEGNPFLVAGFLEPSFYKAQEMPLHSLDDLMDDTADAVCTRHRTSSVAIVAQREEARRQWLEQEGMTLVHRSVPRWVECINHLFRVYDPQWTLLMYAPSNMKGMI